MAGELVDPMASVRAYLAAEKSANTRRAYATDWAQFSTWCKTQRLDALPAAPVTVARYLAHLADGGLKASTVTRAVSAIRYAHRAAGYEPPTNAEGVKAVMRGIRRTKGTRPKRVAPATADRIAAMLEALPTDTLTSLRDRALLLIGFAAARRRSELVDLNVNDVERRPNGAILHIRRSKTDQEGRGMTVAVPNGKRLKPIAALDDWLKAAGISEGPIFREVDRHGRIGKKALSGRSVARIVKRAAAAAGLDEKVFSGHSLRAGFVTTALDDGQDVLRIMTVTGQKDPKTVAAYDRREIDLENAVGKGFL